MAGSHSWRLLARSSSPLFSTLWAGLSAVRLEVFNSSCHQFRLPVGLADVSPASLAFGRSVLLHWSRFKLLAGISALMEHASSVNMMINVHLASLNLLSAVRFFEKLWGFYSCTPRPSEGLTSSDRYMRQASTARNIAAGMDKASRAPVIQSKPDGQQTTGATALSNRWGRRRHIEKTRLISTDLSLV